MYFLPAQTKDWIFPLGADVRYRISEDGHGIGEKRQMHKTVLEFDSKNLPKGVKKIEQSFHTHVLSNTVEDSDVFYVLSRKPAIPEMIATMDKRILEVEVDGTIRDRGKL